jgi:HKD family nuclease
MKFEFLSSPQEHISAFRSALAGAVRVDVAVAWATRSEPSALLYQYAERGGQIRVIVGKDFAGTDPVAVRRLLEAAPLQIRWGWTPFSGVFHPKVFLFHGADEITAMVGSANLTRHAFLYNVEATMLMRGTTEEFGQLQQFFEDRWGAADEVDADNLDAYAQIWLKRREVALETDETLAADESTSAGEAERLVGRALSWDWDEYVVQVRRVDKLWKPFGHSIDAYLDMLEEVPALTAFPLSSLSKVKRLALYGIWSDEYPNAGWLGCMRGAGMARHLLVENDARSRAAQAAVSKALQRIPRDSATLPYMRAVEEAYRALRNIPHIGSAIATRYITLSRPDALVSVNSASQDGLSRILRVPAARLTNWEGYRDALERLWKAPWMRAPRPSDPFEAKLWIYRSALLDAFVYRPASGEHPDEALE